MRQDNYIIQAHIWQTKGELSVPAASIIEFLTILAHFNLSLIPNELFLWNLDENYTILSQNFWLSAKIFSQQQYIQL